MDMKGPLIRGRRFSSRRSGPADSVEKLLFSKEQFDIRLQQETNKAKRAQKPLMWMNIDISNTCREAVNIFQVVSEGVMQCIRETDISGVIEDGTQIGVIFVGVDREKVGITQMIAAKRTRRKLAELLDPEAASRILFTFHLTDCRERQQSLGN